VSKFKSDSLLVRVFPTSSCGSRMKSLRSEGTGKRVEENGVGRRDLQRQKGLIKDSIVS